MDLKHARMAQIRKRLAGRFEHKESDRPGSPVWLFAPFWLRAWAAIDSQPTTAAATVSSGFTAAQRKEHFQALTEEAKYRKLIGELVETTDVAALFAEIGSELSKAIGVAERMHPPAAERFVVALDSAKEKIATRFNVYVDGDTADSPARTGPHRTKQTAARKVAKAVRGG